MIEENTRGRLKRATYAFGGFLLMAVAIIWSWNTLATDIFGLAEIQFKHAIAMGLGLVALRFVFSPGHLRGSDEQA